MKKIFVLGMAAVLLASALVIVSCGSNCPGGAGYPAGECVLSITGADDEGTAKTCKSKDCAINKYAANTEQIMKDMLEGKKINKKCDC